MSYVDSTGWFENSEIRAMLPRIIDPYNCNTMLEVGCFEGVGSAFFSDVFLEHPNSTLTCVDPFLTGDETTPQVNTNTKQRFYENINKSDQREKIQVCEMTSDEFFSQNTELFSIIYIDGDHRYESVKKDLQNAYSCLSPGGILWCDDYAWSNDIQKAVHEFLESTSDMNIIHKRCQIAFQKAR